MGLYDVLKSIGLPCAHSHFAAPVKPPYLVYLGAGQNIMSADNTYYWKRNMYTVEYYFATKNEALESQIENALLDNGYLYDKSEDVYIEGENLFVIYYNV